MASASRALANENNLAECPQREGYVMCADVWRGHGGRFGGAGSSGSWLVAWKTVMSSLRGGGGIFIGYRREETAGQAGRLYDRLRAKFGVDRVFMDVDSISGGTDFTKEIIEDVPQRNVLLVLIGRDWLTVTDSKGKRRIEKPDDPVRVGGGGRENAVCHVVQHR